MNNIICRVRCAHAYLKIGVAMLLLATSSACEKNGFTYDLTGSNQPSSYIVADTLTIDMNTVALDRGRVDTVTTRKILEKLKRGRVVAMFPEGRLQDEAGSVLNGGKIRTGVFGLARKANVPIIPCVILGTRAYSRFVHWMPLRRTFYALVYGQPMFPTDRWDDLAVAEQELRAAYLQLHQELLEAIKGRPIQ